MDIWGFSPRDGIIVDIRACFAHGGMDVPGRSGCSGYARGFLPSENHASIIVMVPGTAFRPRQSFILRSLSEAPVGEDWQASKRLRTRSMAGKLGER